MDQWTQGFMFAYWLERGYDVDEAHALSQLPERIPEHLSFSMLKWKAKINV